MSAASLPAGFGLAGFNSPVIDEVAALLRPVSAYYDPDLREFVLDDGGQFTNVHPVDQEVSLRLGVALGTLAGSPNVGLDVASLKRASAESMQAAVNDAVQTALADLVDRGDIELLGSPLMPDAAGRPFFFVDYRNLRLPADALAVRRQVR